MDKKYEFNTAKGKELGTGAYGKVLETRRRGLGPDAPFDLATKFIFFKDASYFAMATHEGNIMHELNHPNIVRAIDCDIYEGTDIHVAPI
jgi:serine/threonine protein kinase